MDEARGDGDLTWETWNVAPATTTLVTSSAQQSVAFALRGVGFFQSILPPVALDSFSPTAAELGRNFASHPHASNSGLK